MPPSKKAEQKEKTTYATRSESCIGPMGSAYLPATHAFTVPIDRPRRGSFTSRPPRPAKPPARIKNSCNFLPLWQDGEHKGGEDRKEKLWPSLSRESATGAGGAENSAAAACVGSRMGKKRRL